MFQILVRTTIFSLWILPERLCIQNLPGEGLETIFQAKGRIADIDNNETLTNVFLQKIGVVRNCN